MRPLLFAVGMLTAATAHAAWLELSTPRYTIISELTEDDTRQWAVEFDQFIGGLEQFYPRSELELALPPLTMVMFDRERAFSPYRPQSDAESIAVQAFFVNHGTWSVIGMAGQRRAADMRRVVYHEAVHWFASSRDAERPIWYEEGLAEVLSTFQARDGRGIWGAPHEDSVYFFSLAGVQPLGDFLRVTREESLQKTAPGYYPQAWAFTHYLMFGKDGRQRTTLEEFLRQRSKAGLDTAFANAFGKSYDEVTADLRSYLDAGAFGSVEFDLSDRRSEFAIAPAPPVRVELALARLAIASGNHALGRKHAEAALALAPDSAAAHAVLAVAAQDSADRNALTIALERAIALGSDDAYVYATKAALLIEEGVQQDATIDTALEPSTARAVFDLYARALALRPQHRDAYEGLMLAALNLDAFTADDDQLLTAGRQVLPTHGVILVSQAAAARKRGELSQAMELLRAADKEPYALSPRARPAVRDLREAWFTEWLGGELQTLSRAGRYAEARALVEGLRVDESLTPRSLRTLERMAGGILVMEKVTAAESAAQRGRFDEAREIIRGIIDDPEVPGMIKSQAQRMLERLP